MTNFTCPNCNSEMELHDTTYSNMNTHRASVGQHTGDIYRCNSGDCEDEPDYIDDFLTGEFYEWSYQ